MGAGPDTQVPALRARARPSPLRPVPPRPPPPPAHMHGPRSEHQLAAAAVVKLQQFQATLRARAHVLRGGSGVEGAASGERAACAASLQPGRAVRIMCAWEGIV